MTNPINLIRSLGEIQVSASRVLVELEEAKQAQASVEARLHGLQKELSQTQARLDQAMEIADAEKTAKDLALAREKRRVHDLALCHQWMESACKVLRTSAGHDAKALLRKVPKI